MVHELSFAHIKFLSKNIAEVIVHNNVEITIEMVEEYDQFLTKHFKEKFALLINKINHYGYTYEAKLTIGSKENIVAMAVVNYHPTAVETTQQLAKARVNDKLNLKQFSGLEMGYQKAFTWLTEQLTTSA